MINLTTYQEITNGFSSTTNLVILIVGIIAMVGIMVMIIKRLFKQE